MQLLLCGVSCHEGQWVDVETDGSLHNTASRGRVGARIVPYAERKIQFGLPARMPAWWLDELLCGIERSLRTLIMCCTSRFDILCLLPSMPMAARVVGCSSGAALFLSTALFFGYSLLSDLL